MVERETSVRRIREVFRHPAVAPYFKDLSAQDFIPAIGQDAYYLKIGDGFLIYLRHGDWAEMHAALVPGTVGPGFVSRVKEQFDYLFSEGIRRIVAAPAAEHRRAALMCGAVGMKRVPGAPGFSSFEVTCDGKV